MPIHGTPLVSGLYVNFQAAVLQQLPRDLDDQTMQELIRDQGSLKKALGEALTLHREAKALPDIDWGKVYELLGLSSELEEFLKDRLKAMDLIVPNVWVIPVLKQVTIPLLFEKLRTFGFQVYIEPSINNVRLVMNDRDPKKGSYIVKFEKKLRADPNQSLKLLMQTGVKGITFTERLLLELGYVLTTGKHLDPNGLTYCIGSRFIEHNTIPSVGWRVQSLCIYSYTPFISGEGGVTTRVVVS